MKTLVQLGVCLAVLMGAVAAHAEDENVTCTLKKAVKVRVGTKFVVVDAGTDVLVKVRRSGWTTVIVPKGPGITSTVALEKSCLPLPPRPPEPPADTPKVTKKPTPKPKPAAKPKPTAKPKPPKKPTKKPAPPPETAPEAPEAPEAAPETPAETPAEAPEVVATPEAPPAAPETLPTPEVVPAMPATPEGVPTPEATTPTTTPGPDAVPAPAAIPDVVPPAAPPAAANDDGRRVMRVAVHELTADPADQKLAQVTTDAVVAELRKLQRLSVIGMDEVRALLDLEAEKQLVGCTDDSCIAEIAEALGADILIVGTLARVGDSRVFGLKRLDPRAAQATGQVNQPLDMQDDAVLAMVGPAIETLFPDVPLRANATRGVAPELHLRLSPPPVPVWATVSVAGAAGAAALIAGGAVAINQLARTEAIDLAKNSSFQQPINGADLVQREATVGTSFVVVVAAGVTAGVVGAGAGVMALFTDWDGYGEQQDSSR